MAPLDSNLLYIKSQFTRNMHALNTHYFSFPQFKNKSRAQLCHGSEVCAQKQDYYPKINVQQLYACWKYFSITTASWITEHSMEK